MAVTRVRAKERGAALFVVVMVIVLLSAIGIFSVRAASLVDVSAGHNRQAVQTAYIAEFGARAAASELVGTQQLYYRLITKGSDHCRANQGLSALMDGVSNLANLAPISCYAMQARDIWERVDSSYPNTVGASSDLELLGALAHDTIQGSFVVEMTDIGLSGAQVAGTEIGKWKHYQLTFTAVGHVFPAGVVDDACAAPLSATSSLQSLRAHVTFGPFSE